MRPHEVLHQSPTVRCLVGIGTLAHGTSQQLATFLTLTSSPDSSFALFVVVGTVTFPSRWILDIHVLHTLGKTTGPGIVLGR